VAELANAAAPQSAGLRPLWVELRPLCGLAPLAGLRPAPAARGRTRRIPPPAPAVPARTCQLALPARSVSALLTRRCRRAYGTITCGAAAASIAAPREPGGIAPRLSAFLASPAQGLVSDRPPRARGAGAPARSRAPCVPSDRRAPPSPPAALGSGARSARGDARRNPPSPPADARPDCQAHRVAPRRSVGAVCPLSRFRN